MLIIKHGKSNKYDTIKFNELINDLELFTGKKQNRIKLSTKFSIGGFLKTMIHLKSFTVFMNFKAATF